ncbi:MAG: potassium-transporting ATPase subunit KdpB [Candidatus Omnitrophica bacterium]|nr:potassium-transporting ATPase subunit KdpB [Candidatus Omnitrophota bacterium]
MGDKNISLWQKTIIINAVVGALKKLDPRSLWESPVMFLVAVGAVVTTVMAVIYAAHGQNAGFEFHISLWLWFTVLFANFSAAIAEGRGKAQAESLKRSRETASAKRINKDGSIEIVAALDLRKGDLISIEDNDIISGDGEIVEGTALINESAVTGESAPVIRESGGDRSGVTAGTKILSGKVKVRITADPGKTFIDQMIAMVEGAERKKTPNEVALEILIIGLTVVFLIVVITFPFFAKYVQVDVSIVVLVSLLVCLIPTTIGGLLPAIGIAGMDRLLRMNVIALSGRAVEASGDVDVVLLDKTGTLTLGNRMATKFFPAPQVTEKELAEAALYSSLADETPEGRSIITLAKERLGIHGTDITPPENSVFIPFSAQNRMSGVDMRGQRIRKGAEDSIAQFVKENSGEVKPEVSQIIEQISFEGGTPLVVADNGRVLGVVQLKDIIKKGINERIGQLRKMGIQSVMITGDNQLTAAAIAAEAGLDDFFAQARPEKKLELIRKYQSQGYLVAMIGDGTNDAPALAQADVAVAMNAGTQVAREAANMVDLDSNPTKLLDIVEIGKQILITRGALTTFSIANDVAKYFAIIPAVFIAQYPALQILNIMHLTNAKSAVLSAVIFNALIIPALIPLALRGVRYKPVSPTELLYRNLLIYGAGGIILPFIGIKIIDMLLNLLHLI